MVIEKFILFFYCWIQFLRDSSSSSRHTTVIFLSNDISPGTPPLNDGVNRFEWELLQETLDKHISSQPIDNEMHLYKIGCLGFSVTGITITPGYASLKPGAFI